jgi:hypothetical protein
MLEYKSRPSEMGHGLPGRHIPEMAGSLKTCRLAAMLPCGRKSPKNGR